LYNKEIFQTEEPLRLSKIIGGNSTEVGGQVGGPMKFKLVEKLVDQRKEKERTKM